MTPALTVIIPTYNDAAVIGPALDRIGRLRIELDIVVVDGGSTDATVGIAQWCGAKVIVAGGCDTEQMHAGAKAARTDILWFLHADADPPHDSGDRILEALADCEVIGGRLLRGAGFFMRRSAYLKAGGFRDVRFAELDLMRRARRYGRFVRKR
jgi:glycosyltransferase involved in cell wall biosynthesis